jgi:hypothetical protein
MKKYLMFMFCLLFAVCLVSFSGCKSNKKGSSDNASRQGQVNLENHDGTPASEVSAGPGHQATDVSDSADSGLVLRVGREYAATLTVDKDNNRGTFTIVDEESGKKAFVDLKAPGGLWNNNNASIKANAKELEIKIEGDNDDNKIYVILFIDRDNKVFFVMYHTTNVNSVRFADFRTDPNLMTTIIIRRDNVKMLLQLYKDETGLFGEEDKVVRDYRLRLTSALEE